MQAIYDVPAPAKLNLFLHVVGKRPDGYHLLQSIFALIDWADTLHFERRADGQLVRHDSEGAGLPPDDLCTRAARALQAATGCSDGVDIHIEKRLPAGAGMGGGSSDAASTLLALNRLWKLNLPLRQLKEIGLRLGADVPFFLGGSHAFVEGIGEILHPIALPPQRFAIIKPAASIATAQIFSSPLLARSNSVAIVAGFPAHNSSENYLEDGFEEGFGNGFGRNDLQKAAEAASPEVIQALAILESKFGNSRMTGSGSAVFARIGDELDNISSKSKKADESMAEYCESIQSTATILQGDIPAGWIGKICSSLAHHPLKGWAAD